MQRPLSRGEGERTPRPARPWIVRSALGRRRVRQGDQIGLLCRRWDFAALRGPLSPPQQYRPRCRRRLALLQQRLLLGFLYAAHPRPVRCPLRRGSAHRKYHQAWHSRRAHDGLVDTGKAVQVTRGGTLKLACGGGEGGRGSTRRARTSARQHANRDRSLLERTLVRCYHARAVRGLWGGS